MANSGVSVWRVRMLVGTAVLLAGVGVATGATSVQAPASATEQQAGAQPAGIAGASKRVSVDWRPCGAENPGYECATLAVPLDHDRPSSGTTRIALARFPASDTRHRVGSVFVNPGGPGGSGVELVVSGFGEALGGQLDGRFDIVGFDPRGVGGSDPLHCFASEEDLLAFFSSQPVFPFRQGQLRPFFNTYADLGPECRDDRQVVARHMSTADVARDLDLLRRAVGDRKLTYLGFSYGSYLGNTYANLFPENVRALAIDGVLDPRLWSRGRQIESDRIATQQEFNEFLRLCDAARKECAFWTAAGSKRRWNLLARAIRRDPLTFPDGFRYTYDFLITDAASAMYAPEVWDGPDGAAALFDALADAALAEDGDATDAARLRAELTERLTAGAEADYPNGLDAYFGNHCADTQYPHTFPAWERIGEYARRGSRFGPYWWWFNAGCAHWPVNHDRYAGPWTARTSAPVLVVGNHFDGVTDHAGAVASDRLLRNSRLLSYAGWGHTAYGRSQCVTDYIDAYLLRVSLPPKGTVCPANPNPYLPLAARTSRGAPLVGLPPPWLVRPGLSTSRSLAGTP